MPSESVREFAKHVETLAYQAFSPFTAHGSNWIHEERCLGCFWASLYDRAIKEYIQDIGPSTFHEAVDLAMAKEDRLTLSRQETQQVLAAAPAATPAAGNPYNAAKDGAGKKQINRNRKKGGEPGKPTLTTSSDSRDLSPNSVRKIRDFLAQRDSSTASASSKAWLGNVVKPQQMEQGAAPASLLKIIRCNCSGSCGRNTCSCKKNGLHCTLACGQCKGITCTNGQSHDDSDSDE